MCILVFLSLLSVAGYAQSGDGTHCVRCPICNKAIANLEKHLLYHTEEPIYLCQYQGCERKFLYPFLVRRHMRCHEGTCEHNHSPLKRKKRQAANTYSCRFCFACFGSKTALHQHLYDCQSQGNIPNGSK